MEDIAKKAATEAAKDAA
jgi:hypothetical protein